MTIKISALVAHNILTAAQIAVFHIKLFHSTGTGISRMQLAKVVIASALVLAVCAEGLPEGTKISTSFDALVVFELCFTFL